MTGPTKRAPVPPGGSRRHAAESAERLGWWQRRVLPKVLDHIMDTAEARRRRQRVCAGLHGEVLEIGFGTGLNLPHLPEAVTRVYALDPLERGWELAAGRIAATPVAVERVGADARTVPLDDRSVDAVLCTWSLCSIPDPERAIAEVARVLRPGGQLRFVEHGRAPDPSIRRWQARTDRAWSWVSCGCHLDRDIVAIVEAGGMRVEQVETGYAPGEPKLLGWTSEGCAVPA